MKLGGVGEAECRPCHAALVSRALTGCTYWACASDWYVLQWCRVMANWPRRFAHIILKAGVSPALQHINLRWIITLICCSLLFKRKRCKGWWWRRLCFNVCMFGKRANVHAPPLCCKQIYFTHQENKLKVVWQRWYDNKLQNSWPRLPSNDTFWAAARSTGPWSPFHPPKPLNETGRLCPFHPIRLVLHFAHTHTHTHTHNHPTVLIVSE